MRVEKTEEHRKLGPPSKQPKDPPPTAAYDLCGDIDDGVAEGPKLHPEPAEGLWTRPLFETAPADLIAATDQYAAVAGEPVTFILDDGHITFDASGRASRRYRDVWRYETAEGVEDWSVVRVRWAPHFQRRPTIRARVTTADGRVFTLDPTTISESGIGRAPSGAFTDGRQLHAPLPGAALGAVVEYETVIEDSQPPLAGRGMQFSLGSTTFSARHAKFRVDAPIDLPLHHAVHRAALTPDVREVDGRRVLRFELVPAPKFGPSEPLMPTDVPRSPPIARTTRLLRAERAADRTYRLEANPLRTLAALYAHHGRPADARRVSVELAALWDREPTPADAFIEGRIAEAYGLDDIAREAYRRAVAESDDTTRRLDLGKLAARRLEALPGAPAEGARP